MKGAVVDVAAWLTRPAAVSRQRPVLGLRRMPGRLALAVFGVPRHLYCRDRGWMLGRTFLLLVHVGRTTGDPHATVVMVLADDPSTNEVVICSAWGPDADWVRNLSAGPAREVAVGRDHFVPEHRFLTDDEAFDVATGFRRRHPRRLWLIGRILGSDDLRRDDALRDFVRHHPFIGLRPAEPTTPPEGPEGEECG